MDTEESTKPSEPETPAPKPAADVLLNNFLKDNNIELSFGPMKTRQVSDGAVIVDLPQIIASYK